MRHYKSLELILQELNVNLRAMTSHLMVPGAGVVLGILLLVSSASARENSRLSLPRSGLGDPYAAPIILAGHGSLGFGGVMDGVQWGGGASFLLRPGTAERYLPILQEWNTALVLQAEYHHVNEDQRILSGGMLFRHYLQPLTTRPGESVPFVGVGVGASEVTLAGGGFEKGWEFLAEGGQEWSPREDLLVYWKLQYRDYRYHGQDFSHWALQAGIGLPWPW